MDVKRYEGTSPLRDISQHILDILKFDVLPDCSGSNWIHLEDIRQNEQLGSRLAGLHLRNGHCMGATAQGSCKCNGKSQSEGFEVQELYIIHFLSNYVTPDFAFFQETST